MRNWTLNGPEQEWFNKAQAALYLEISERTLDRLIAKGYFPRGIRSTPNGPLRWTGLDIAVYLYLRSRCFDHDETAEPPAETTTEK